MSSKKRRADYESDDGFVEDGAPSSKRSKPGRSSGTTQGKQLDENGDPFWEISSSGARRVTVSEFKGRYMVNIREYYEKDGKKLPGKKGISLPLDQYYLFLQSIPGIEAALRSKGQSVPRPHYDGAPQRVGDVPSDADDSDKAESGDAGSKGAKANYAATSEEDD